MTEARDSDPASVAGAPAAGLPLAGNGGIRPVRIRTLGSFALDLEMAASSRIALHGRPLQLLQALLSFNPDGTSTRLLADTLWPDADGDAAHHVLEVNLQRLRRVLGRADALLLDGGVLSLDRCVCQVDIWTLHELGRDVDRRACPQPLRLSAQLLEVWQGEFLPGREASWVLVARRQLCSRAARIAEALGQWLVEEGQGDAAIDLHRRIIEVDPLAEAVCRQLMQLLLSAGRHAEALLAGEDCAAALLARLGRGPSPLTHDLALRIRRDAAKADGSAGSPIA